MRTRLDWMSTVFGFGKIRNKKPQPLLVQEINRLSLVIVYYFLEAKITKEIFLPFQNFRAAVSFFLSEKF